MKIAKALVTGGAGFIGSHTVDRLLARGIEVIVLDDLSTGKRANVPPGARFVEGDVCDVNLLTELSAEVDVVFHLAARVSVRNSVPQFYEDARVNIFGTVTALQAISKAKRVKKLVYASSMAVYGEGGDAPISEEHPLEPVSPYGIGKLASEKYCLQIGRLCGFDVVVLRYFNTYGPRQTFTPYVGVMTIFIGRVLSGKAPIIFGSGDQVRDFVSVDDVAEANLLAMDSAAGSGIYNVGSGRGMSINELARMILRALGSDLRSEYAPQQPGELQRSVADISRATRLLGYRPCARLEEKVQTVIDWWKDQPHV